MRLVVVAYRGPQKGGKRLDCTVGNIRDILGVMSYDSYE